jgi:hypothetical protein
MAGSESVQEAQNNAQLVAVPRLDCGNPVDLNAHSALEKQSEKAKKIIPMRANDSLSAR